MASRSKVLQTLDSIADEFGIPKPVFRALAEIESGLNPRARTGSYRGLFQMSSSQFKKHGGKGDIYGVEDNARAAAKKLLADSKRFKKRVGRDPTPTDLYMMHQQGRAGSMAHAANPNKPAWQNIRPYYTDAAAKKKGFASGDDYAKAAVWGNLPASAKRKFGSVDNVTSENFTSWWGSRVARGIRRQGGDPQLVNASFSPGGAPLPGQRPPTPRRQNKFDQMSAGVLPEDAGNPSFTPGRRSASASTKLQGFDALSSDSGGEGMLSSVAGMAPSFTQRDEPVLADWLTGEWEEKGPKIVAGGGAEYDGILAYLKKPGVFADLMGRAFGDMPTPSPLLKGGATVGGQANRPAHSINLSGRPSPVQASTSFTPELTNRTFGEPFGQLFQNKASSGIGRTPAAPPLFKNLFSRFGG